MYIVKITLLRCYKQYQNEGFIKTIEIAGKHSESYLDGDVIRPLPQAYKIQRNWAVMFEKI